MSLFIYGVFFIIYPCKRNLTQDMYLHSKLQAIDLGLD